MYQVSEVMDADVLTVSSGATVENAVRSLVENRISGLPVIDGTGALVGIVTEFELLETLYSPRVRELLVGDMMTKDVLTVGPDSSLAEATDLMVVHRIRRLPVVDGGKLVGVVSRRDLLRYTLDAGDKLDEFLSEISAVSGSDSSVETNQP